MERKHIALVVTSVFVIGALGFFVLGHARKTVPNPDEGKSDKDEEKEKE